MHSQELIPILLISVLALLLSNLLHYNKVKGRYAKGNVALDMKLFFQTDALMSIAGTVLMLGIMLVLVGPVARKYPLILTDFFFATLVIFAFAAYTGASLAVSFFSVIQKRYDTAVDYKTNIADAFTGNLGKPTPALKPSEPLPAIPDGIPVQKTDPPVQ